MGVVERELARVMGDVSLVPLPQPDVEVSSSSVKKLYLLQRWSKKWGAFVDVKDAEEVKDGDKLTAVPVYSPATASTSNVN